jgi:hypothetical protein
VLRADLVAEIDGELETGFRACGKGSTATIRPTRMSTFRKSSKVICGEIECA